MRIVIDLQGAQTESRFRGIGRYSLSLTKAIVRNAGEHEIWIALNGLFSESVLALRDEFRDLLPQERIRVFHLPAPVAEHDPGNSDRTRAAELIREYFLEQFNPDVVLVTSLFEGYLDDAVTSIGKFANSYKTAVVLYDLIPYMDESRYLPTKIQKEYYYKKIDSLKNADVLLAISQSSKEEGETALYISAEKVVNISTAVDETFKPMNLSPVDKQALHAKYNISKKMVMYAPGGYDVRKNFENLIIAYGKLPQYLRDEHQLVIASKVFIDYQLCIENSAQKAGLKKNEHIFTGYVSDEELIGLYSTCTLFVFPSLHEGFGLPALEAMACGAAVIGSNTTSLPEVIGYDKALFDPGSVESIAQKMQEVLENESFLKELQKHSLEQSKKFTWDESAKRALRAIESNKTKDKFSVRTHEDLTQQIANLGLGFTDMDLLSFARAIELNSAYQDKTLYVDITQLRMVDYGTGIQRVVKAVISEIYGEKIGNYDTNLVYLEFNDGFWQYKRALDFEKKYFDLECDDDNYAIEPKSGDVFLGLDLMSWVVDAERQELFTDWRCRGVSIQFVVYDILPILHPEWWPENGGNIHTKWLTTIAKVSDKLISISKAVSDDVELWIREHNIQTPKSIEYQYFHLGADTENAIPSKGLPENADNVLQCLGKTKTFLMVGTIEPRKAHRQALHAFEKLWGENADVNLVIVGKQGWMMDDFVTKVKNHPELNKRLFWLEGISDEYLEKIYAVSTCLIAASEGEGFGLPLIEAAQHKLPIIARDIPVFREVAGEHAYYFPSDSSPEVLAGIVQEWLELNKGNSNPKSDNMPWLTWAQSAQKITELMMLNNSKK
jgi:glycosyltransferase involved in cell wall biosynthesis